MPNYVYDSSGVLTIHLTATDVGNGGIDLFFDADGNSIAHIDTVGNMNIKDSAIEEAVMELGESL